MRTWIAAVVILGLFALVFLAIDAIGTTVPAPVDPATGPERGGAVQRLIAWAVIVGVTALATFAGGAGSLLRTRRPTLRRVRRRTTS